jgi:flagellar M-ring protein FliF
MIVPFQQQAVNFWQRQSKPQRITMIVLLLAAAIIIPVLISWSTQTSYDVLFTQLSDTDAGQIVTKLKADNIPYQVKDGGTILVPTTQVNEVRLSLASQGIPQSSTVGYEIFDNSSLGISQFNQQVNYQRAQEGELERTIGSLDSVASVRVHIVTPEKDLFASEQKPPTASVTLKTKSGKQISASQVNAITHLVANAVEGLKPENVVLVDSNGKMLTNPNANNAEMDSISQADSHTQIEQQSARTIQDKVQTMLDSVLGANHSTVQASVAMDWSQLETTSQTFNPTPAAVRSSHTIDETYTLGGSAGGVPGAASNLPTPVPTLIATTNATLYHKNEATTNYELTQVQSKQVAAPGKVQRISVSVMVDNIKDTAQMASIKNAVIAAAGIDSARGDTVAVESMAFDHTAAAADLTQQTQADQTSMYFRYAEMAAGAVAALILLIIVMRLFGSLRKSASEQWKPVMRPVSEMALAAGMPGGSPAARLNAAQSAYFQLPQATQDDEEIQAPAAAAEQPANSTEQVQNRIAEIMARTQTTAEDEQLQNLLGKMSEDNPATVAEIIQMWLNEG